MALGMFFVCAGARAHSRSLGCARDDKGEGGDFYLGPVSLDGQKRNSRSPFDFAQGRLSTPLRFSRFVRHDETRPIPNFPVVINLLDKL